MDKERPSSGDTTVKTDTDEVEPKITSLDPDERKLARRLRIQRRNQVLRRQTLYEKNESSLVEEIEKTPVEWQVETSEDQLEELLVEGAELVTNVCVTSDVREVERRREQVELRKKRLAKLEDAAAESSKQFKAISSKWSSILNCNDPLDIHQDVELQRVKCNELINQKDMLIEDLRKELLEADERFNKDQMKMKEDVALLSERIDKQVIIMKKAYEQELKLIEETTVMERQTLMEACSKKWESLYQDREKEEIHNMEKRFQTVSEFEEEIRNLIIDHHEKYRSTKIKLDLNIQVLQQEVQQVKACCLLNSEKLDYNYQVLKKRDEENTIMKAQQKRRINKLQDVLTALKKTIREGDKQITGDTTKLSAEVLKLHRNIMDVEVKSDHFSEANERKYQEVWKLNRERAQELLDKILEIDHILHEQQLGLEWAPPDQSLLTKSDLASYRSAQQVVAEIFKKKQEATATSKAALVVALDESWAYEKLLKHILQQLADNTGFLVEERLQILLEPFEEEQKKLVKIDNVFTALGINSEEDMRLMVDIFLPYCKCGVCETETSKPIEELELRNAMYHSTESTTSLPLDTTDEATECRGTSEQFKTGSPLDRLASVRFKDPNSARSSSTEERKSPLDSAKVSSLCQNTNSKLMCCRNHPLTIESIYVLKALKEFATKFRMGKDGVVENMSSRLCRKRSTVSRLLAGEDVVMYWMRFRQIFPPQNEKLWDSLYLGLRKYHQILEDRHKLNEETDKLRNQNAELRRMLHSYMSCNENEKAFLSSQEFLPKITKKDLEKQQKMLRKILNPDKKLL